MFPRDDLAGAVAEGSSFHVIDYDGEVEDVSNIKRHNWNEIWTILILYIPYSSE